MNKRLLPLRDLIIHEPCYTGWSQIEDMFCSLRQLKSCYKRKVPYSRMWCRMALVRAEVSKESIISIIRVKRISELGKLAVISNWSTLDESFHTDDGDHTFFWNVGCYENISWTWIGSRFIRNFNTLLMTTLHKLLYEKKTNILSIGVQCSGW
jgi:hypothetical protein